MNSNKLNRDRRSPFSSIVEWKLKVRNGYCFVLLKQIFISEVSLERGKFPLQDYIHNSKFFFALQDGFSYRRSHMYFTSLYWSFLSTFTLLHCIESSWVHVLYVTLLKLFEYMYFTSLYRSFLSTFTLLHCIESSWVHEIYYTVLNLLK